MKIKRLSFFKTAALFVVERTGLEPVTSALSKQRSEPTELTFLLRTIPITIGRAFVPRVVKIRCFNKNHAEEIE